MFQFLPSDKKTKIWVISLALVSMILLVIVVKQGIKVAKISQDSHEKGDLPINDAPVQNIIKKTPEQVSDFSGDENAKDPEEVKDPRERG